MWCIFTVLIMTMFDVLCFMILFGSPETVIRNGMWNGSPCSRQHESALSYFRFFSLSQLLLISDSGLEWP